MKKIIALVTNIPSPYRVLLFDKVAENLSENFYVFYCAKIEANRKWDIPEIHHNHIFLKKSILKSKWLNIDIIKQLIKINPDIIITAGFFPTSLMAFLYTRYYKKKHIVFTDSWLHSVNNLSIVHKCIRKFIFKKTFGFIAVGKKGKKYLEIYGAPKDRIFISPLSIDNNKYIKFVKPIDKKEFDLMFSGQFVYRKLPFFVINIVKKIYDIGLNVKLLLIGSGLFEEEIVKELKNKKITYTYPGFIQQNELPKYYSNAKILLFPTKDDPWGIVANEACVAGTPVITCDNAGVANDLIINNINGYVLPLDEDVWVQHIIGLLSNNNKLKRFSQNALDSIKNYSIELAAKGIFKSCRL